MGSSRWPSSKVESAVSVFCCLLFSACGREKVCLHPPIPIFSFWFSGADVHARDSRRGMSSQEWATYTGRFEAVRRRTRVTLIFLSSKALVNLQPFHAVTLLNSLNSETSILLSHITCNNVNRDLNRERKNPT